MYLLSRGGEGYMMGYGALGAWGIYGIITWLALLAYLVLGSVYYWKQIQKK